MERQLIQRGSMTASELIMRVLLESVIDERRAPEVRMGACQMLLEGFTKAELGRLVVSAGWPVEDTQEEGE